jgi:transcriptional regulator with XRE-family HTH domain
MAKGDNESRTLLQLMDEKRVSQRDVAKGMGISQPALNKLLNGRTAWKMTRWQDALAAIGVTERELQALKETTAPAVSAPDFTIMGLDLDKDLRRRLENIARRKGQGGEKGRLDLKPLVKMAIAEYVEREESSFRGK